MSRVKAEVIQSCIEHVQALYSALSRKRKVPSHGHKAGKLSGYQDLLASLSKYGYDAGTRYGAQTYDFRGGIDALRRNAERSLYGSMRQGYAEAVDEALAFIDANIEIEERPEPKKGNGALL